MNKTLASRRRHVARKLSAIALRIRRITVARAMSKVKIMRPEDQLLRDELAGIASILETKATQLTT